MLAVDERPTGVFAMQRVLVTLAAMAAACAPAAFAQNRTANELRAEVPRTAGGKPMLDGIWQAFATANWDVRAHAAAPAALAQLGARHAVPPGLGVIDDDELPYQDWARAKQLENQAKSLELDPEVKCFMPGVPRATYMPHPFQIFQTDEYVMIAYQFAGAVRTIYMEDPGPSPTEFWMGWSVGHWEGDTLVVEVTGQVEGTWFDRAGNFHSDALRVTERYTPLGPNHLQYEATIEDPKVFTRPWTISMPLYRRIEPNMQLLEFKCVPFSEEVLYGHLRKRPEQDGSESEGNGDE